MDNYDNVMKAIRIFNDKDAFNIGARKITISTCGVVPGIERLSKEGLQVELSVSLHSANEGVRSRLLPVNKRYGLKALMDLTGTPEFTAMVLLCDKEEIGSVGATGMHSTFFENAVAEMLVRQEAHYSDLTRRRCLACSRMISADVTAAHDPNYPEVSSPNNMAILNGGLAVAKYTGHGGKSGCSEASAEFMAEIRRIFNGGKVLWQTGELGKVDQGGGGTISLFMARYGMDVVDAGVPLLSMHAPWELAAKLDCYMSYKGYREFFAHRHT